MRTITCSIVQVVPVVGSQVLHGLDSLLFYYIPLVFSLGYKVRKLTWEGGLDGTVKGDLAKEVLAGCLALHLQLLGDWECKAEYTRTLSVALLCWQPMYSTLPGCCFVEESCEAMLSRMVARCRSNYQLTSFTDVLRLFVTLAPPAAQSPCTRGGLRQSLVYLLTQRVQRILASPHNQPFSKLMSAREVTWQSAYPDDFQFPQSTSEAVQVTQVERVLQCALISLTGRGPFSDQVRSFVDANIPKVARSNDLVVREAALTKVAGWRVGRSQPTPRRSAATQRPLRVSVDGDAYMDQATSSNWVPTVPQANTAVLDDPVGTLRPEQPVLQSQPESMGSEVGSVYEPPALNDAASAGYESFGDTDSLGSVGALVGDADTLWGTLEDDGLFDYLGSGQNDPGRSSLRSFACIYEPFSPSFLETCNRDLVKWIHSLSLSRVKTPVNPVLTVSLCSPQVQCDGFAVGAGGPTCQAGAEAGQRRGRGSEVQRGTPGGEV